MTGVPRTIKARFELEEFTEDPDFELPGGEDDIVQAPVEAEVASPTWSLTLLGITAGTAELEDQGAHAFLSFVATTPSHVIMR